ncbi:hypothetical protein AVEN_54510-1 [Araneus ventricosus]|uniref:Uncharacterized protein n=1 Tax=Araneus ventricosus TaxID=182803 RepID=A0A4Y2EHW9_ARAVE|nr:hypothetical protein AVEN_54510-1 [Araneus ventricosus]
MPESQLRDMRLSSRLPRARVSTSVHETSHASVSASGHETLFAAASCSGPEGRGFEFISTQHQLRIWAWCKSYPSKVKRPLAGVVRKFEGCVCEGIDLAVSFDYGLKLRVPSRNSFKTGINRTKINHRMLHFP